MNELCRTRVFSVGWKGVYSGLCLAFALLANCDAVPVFGQDPPLSQQVEELVKQLDADREQERDEAERKLLALGTDAMEFLPGISEDASPEYRMRLERIQKKFFDESMASFHEPTIVNLVGSMTPLDALASIEKQTRNKISLGQYKNQQAFLEIQDYRIEGLTYWEAIDEILESIQWLISPSDNDQIRFQADQSIPENDADALKNLPHSVPSPTYLGVLRMQPVATYKSNNFFAPLNSVATVELVLQWEPRFTPILVRFHLEDLKVLTDNAEILQPTPNQDSEFVPAGSQLIASIEVLRPSLKAELIASWKGTLDIAIPGRKTSVQFSDLQGGVGQKIDAGGLSVALEASRKNKDVHEIRLGVSLRELPENELLQGWTGLADAYLVDKEGNKLENAGSGTTRVTKKDIGLRYLFDLEKDLSEYKLVFVAPDSVLMQTIDYELRNIPLP